MIEARSPRFLTPNTTPDPARARMSHAWAFVFNCHAQKNAASVDSANGDDVKESKNESRRKDIIPNTN